jgi:hypothetical protein
MRGIGSGRIQPEESRPTTNRALLEPTLPWIRQSRRVALEKRRWRWDCEANTSSRARTGLGRRSPGNTSRRRQRSLSEVRDQTVRQGGFDGSVSAKLAGPIPQIATTAGSFWPRITPSKCGVPATRCTKLPASAHTHEPGSKSAPLLTHQAPETTTQNRSIG